MDGGPSDNLGVLQVFKSLNDVRKTTRINNDKCLIIVIDAYNYSALGKSVRDIDTRDFISRIFDLNAIDAADIMLSQNRKLAMEMVTKSKDIGFNAYYDLITTTSNDSCNVWHITFQNLYATEFERAYANSSDIDKLQQLYRIRDVVNAIPTKYQLVETQGYSPESVQDYIFKAARILVKQDKYQNTNSQVFPGNTNGELIYKKICKDFKDIINQNAGCNNDFAQTP